MTPVVPKGTLSAREAARRAARPQAIADRRPLGDLSISGMRLRGRTISAQLRGLITDAQLERSIDTASTLTIHTHDRAGRLWRSGVLHRGAQLVVDGLAFRLARIEKNDDSWVLTFEDEAVWLLRQQTEPRKATRSAQMTRAKFIESMLREIKRPRIGLWAPERDVVQQIAAGDTGGSEPYEFSRGTLTTNTTGTGDAADGESGEKEDSWTAIRRLADEVQWRAFMVAGVLHLATDKTLLEQATRFVVSERTRGIDRITWTLDEGMAAADATIVCQAARWSAPPGTIVALTGQGPANGAWIVAGMRRALGSSTADITLTRPREALPEPTGASPQATSTLSGGGPESVDACARKAQQIHDLHQPYLWGGYGPTRFDCSGGVSAVLNAGGLLSGRLTTSGLINWGEPGQGEYMTVWVKETGDPRRSHTFMSIYGRWWEAGGTRGALTGWRGSKDTSGFTPRHAPGT